MLSKICCLSSEACSYACWPFSRNKTIKMVYIGLMLAVLSLTLLLKGLWNPSSSTKSAFACSDSPDPYTSENCVINKTNEIIFAATSFMHLVVLGCMFMKS